MAKSRMVNQMSEQMDMPKSEAKSLMNKAKQMNDVEMAEGGAARAFRYNDNGGKGTF